MLTSEVFVHHNRLITVNYAQSLEEMIAAGKYDWTDEYITAENFQIQGNGVVNLEIVLFHPNRDIESEDVVKELDQMGLRPATLPELCAYGAKYPETQREFPIVALDSSWVGPSGECPVPCLDGDECSRERLLDLYYWADEWDADVRFAAVLRT